MLNSKKNIDHHNIKQADEKKRKPIDEQGQPSYLENNNNTLTH